MATVRLNDDVKEKLDQSMQRKQQTSEDKITANDALAMLLMIAEQHEAEDELSSYECESVALVRQMLSRVGDEMVTLVLHDKRSFEEELAVVERANEEKQTANDALTTERDELVAKVEKLTPYVDEVDKLRAKVAEADEIKANTEKLLAESQSQKLELFEQLSALMDEVKRANEAVERERERNEQLQEKLDVLIEKLSSKE